MSLEPKCVQDTSAHFVSGETLAIEIDISVNWVTCQLCYVDNLKIVLILPRYTVKVLLECGHMPKEFSSLLKEQLEIADITPYRLAQLSGISRSTISKLMLDKIQPSWEVVLRIATALSISTETFRVHVSLPDAPEQRSQGRPKHDDKIIRMDPSKIKSKSDTEAPKPKRKKAE